MFRDHGKRRNPRRHSRSSTIDVEGEIPKECGVLEVKLKYFNEEGMGDHLCKMMLIGEVKDESSDLSVVWTRFKDNGEIYFGDFKFTHLTVWP